MLQPNLLLFQHITLLMSQLASAINTSPNLTNALPSLEFQLEKVISGFDLFPPPFLPTQVSPR